MKVGWTSFSSTVASKISSSSLPQPQDSWTLMPSASQ